ncbi:MAG: hypothetical protein A2Y42_03925 [Omnitrophica WOR_2 bacterium GWB2_45_9]|nr:MAG: hypothetical protein A2Y42_03925 [Omnitrophica WOR_2 bacterium GWB2_45_9]OGX60078.1 MAG: hypothetical protein A2471_02860 [Omnitrophica WOR_2 bacterium RIFOXYC2_FULL_45_15]HBU08498.1 hypothetical protein [Candidatus Omnitrophota bacterium]
MNWDPNTQERFKLMISKMPVFHRRIAEEAVTLKAQENANARGAALVSEEDVISALFSDVPKPFYSLMIRLLEDTGFDYRKHGFPKSVT